MQIVVPMAGRGDRFLRAGYSTIKPLIPIDGEPMIRRVIGMFPDERDFVFICARDHLETTPLAAVLKECAPGGRVVGIEPHKKGPVWTCLAAADLIADDEPVFVTYCDYAVHWNFERFKETMHRAAYAGAITAYKGFHPHSLGPNLYGYLREKDNLLLEIKEKASFTDDRMNEYASAGGYFFQSGALMKRFFRAAHERGLQTNGEFYASLPFNLMVGEGLDVYIYEVEHFLQWGTPEDLEEYLNWSAYFRRKARFHPGRMEGCRLIPMAGAGERFSAGGYVDPKPLIPVDGEPMAARSLASFPQAELTIALCLSTHLEISPITQVLNAVDQSTLIFPVEGLTEGQAATCLLARDALDPTAPLLIAPCDAAVIFDPEEFRRLTINPDVDCLVWTFRNHPHGNRNPLQYGWVQTDQEGRIQSISCKIPISDHPENDPGVIGIFWFRAAEIFIRAADRLIEQNRRVNNEFYVDSAIETTVELGYQCRIFDVINYAGLGNPGDVRTYTYWASYFRKTRPDWFAGDPEWTE